MTIKNILKIAIPSVLALGAAVIFCGSYFNADDRCYYCGAPNCPEGTTCSVCWSDNCPNVIGKSRFCTHPIDQEYTEPTVKPGKYYFNGDINSCYLEITENTWQLIPTEDCDFHALAHAGNLAMIKEIEETPQSGISVDEINIDAGMPEEYIAFYSMPHEYVVTTWHAFDLVWLTSDPSEEMISNIPQEFRKYGENHSPYGYWQDGRCISQGLVLVDKNTISGYGGDYILVE